MEGRYHGIWNLKHFQTDSEHRIRRVLLKRRCYVDESKVYGNTLPSRLRTIKQRVHKLLLAQSVRYTCTGNYPESTIAFPLLRRENCNDENFLTNVQQTLAPHLTGRIVVIWDRLGRSGRSRNPTRIHYNPKAIAAVRGRRCSVVFLPPKGKYLNPIEDAFNTLLAGHTMVATRGVNRDQEH